MTRRVRHSRVGWALGVVAPWCLAIALLVSITADAGQDTTIGGSYASRSSAAAEQPAELIPAALTGRVNDFDLGGRPLLQPVHLDLGTPEDFRAAPSEIEPRATLKPRSGNRPSINRTNKGDPSIGLRPSFDSQLRRHHGLIDAEVLGPHDDAMPAASFSIEDEAGPLDGATGFVPWAAGEDMQDDGAVGAVAMAMRPAALKERLAQGATPKVSRADALSSTTPAPADGAPVAVIFSPQQLAAPNMSIVPRVVGRPDYAGLLTGDRGTRERRCLAEAVYFEARSEPEEGQAAVAQVVLNRATSGLYPASICGVVYQNRTHYKACQFSFACEGKSLRVTEPEAWRTAVRISSAVLDGHTYVSDVGGATHYHAKYVRPGWARRLVKMDVIGHHIFYKLKRGQV